MIPPGNVFKGNAAGVYGGDIAAVA